jgi:hypothetical protein
MIHLPSQALSITSSSFHLTSIPRLARGARTASLASPFRARLIVLSDERQKSRDAGVNTGVVGIRASIAPRNNADKHLGAVDNGATGVTLAGVLSTLTSAEHAVGDGTGAVLGAAGGAGNDRDADFEQVDGEGGAAGGGSSPASDGEGGASSGVQVGGGQRGVADSAGGGDGGGQLPDGDVVVGLCGVVAGVDGHGGDADQGTAGGTGLSGCVSIKIMRSMAETVRHKSIAHGVA